jgi:hypothetical protein
MTLSTKILLLFSLTVLAVSCNEATQINDEVSSNKEDSPTSTQKSSSEKTKNQDQKNLDSLTPKQLLKEKYSSAKLRCDYGSALFSKENSSSLSKGTSHALLWDLLTEFDTKPKWRVYDGYTFNTGLMPSSVKVRHQITIREVVINVSQSKEDLLDGSMVDMQYSPSVVLDYGAHIYASKDALPNFKEYQSAEEEYQVNEGKEGFDFTSEPQPIADLWEFRHRLTCRLVTTLKPEYAHHYLVSN